jgi:hypothetical protein
MSRTIQELAEAFSRHDFALTYPHMVDDIRWNLVGEKEIAGKDDVISTCDESSAYLEDVETRFSKFRTVVGENIVVVDTIAEYIDQERDVSFVASCDIYDFADGRLTEINSYTLELDS